MVHQMKEKSSAVILALIMALLIMPFFSHQAQADSTWAAVTGFPSEMMAEVAYGNGCFIAISYDTGKIYKSTDNGETWTLKATENRNLGYIAFGNGTFIATDNSREFIFYSQDNGETWTEMQIGSTGGSLNGITYGSCGFVVVGCSTKASIFVSGNGISAWSNPFFQIDPDGIQGLAFANTCYGNGTYIAVGSNGRVYHSTNATMWTLSASVPNSEYYMAVDYGEGLFVAVSSSGSIITSNDDGINWTQVYDSSNNFNDIAYGNGCFHAVGNDGAIVKSYDGINWSADTSGTTANLWGIGYGNKHFIVTGNSGLLLARGPSSDVSLASVLTMTDSSTSGAGTSGDPVMWEVGVDNAVSSLSAAGIAAADGATVNLYSDLGFSTEVTGTDVISLTEGGTKTAYIKVTAEDGTTVKYYAVAIFRAAPPDTTAPGVFDGAITASGITQTRAMLSWNKATDNVSAQAALQYLVYQSGSNNLNSVADIEANGIPLGSYAADIATKDVTGLAAATTYYFNVVVKDEAGNKTCYTAKSVTTLPDDITSASISGITAPTAGIAPIAMGSLIPGDSSYTVSGLTWQNGDGSAAALTAGGKFMAGASYKAEIELTSADGYKFQAVGFTPAVNTGTPQAGKLNGGDVSGNTLTFAIAFPNTAAKAVTGIAVTTQPAKMSYTETTDGTLALNGMVVTQTYNDGTSDTVSFTDGTAPGYTANPANGTALTQAVHNGTKVAITHTASGQMAQTGIMTVAPAPTYGISLDPGTNYAFPAATVGYSAQSAHTVTVNNTGTGATGPLTVVLGGTNPAAFELSAISISSIAASGSDSFSIAPKTGLASGNYTATVTVSGGSVVAQSFDVSFIVNDTFGIFLNPGADYPFPAATAGYGAQSAHTVTVNNTGTGVTGLLTVALGGINPTAFELSATSISSIAASGSDSFTVAPKTGLVAGAYTATVTVSGGSVVAQSFDVSFIVNDTFGIFLNPGTEDTFPAAEVGYGIQAAHTITVFNSGTGSTGLLTVALSGTNPAAFELSATSISSIVPSGSGSFIIAPITGLVSGTYTATVTVSGGSVVPRSIDVSFSVGDTFGISLDPGADYTFPAVTVGYGAQAAHTVTVNNEGTGATGLLTVSLGGTNSSAFELSAASISSIVVSGSDSFTVAPITGLASGTYTATVTVSGGSVASRSFDVSFTVNNTYGASLDPGTDYTFPAAAVGYGAQTARAVTVNNTGTGVTGTLTVALGGVNSSAFELSATSISSIVPSGSGNFTVAPKTGLAEGSYAATVTLSGGSVTSQSFNISFTVNPSYGVALSPAADYIFPEAAQGYEAQIPYDIAVSNTGTGATGTLTAVLSGVNPDAFTLSKASFSSIAPLGSDSFAITPKTGLAAGNYTATVTVSGGFSIVPQSLNVSFKVNYVMSEGVLEKQVESATIIAEGMFAEEARLIVTPIAEGDTDRAQLEEQLTAQNAIAAYEVHVEPAEAFRPPLTLTFQVGQSFNGRIVYILHKLSNGSTDIYTPTVENGEAVITVNELSPFLLAVDPAVVITRQPQSTLALIGQTADFHVEANGLDLTYQWQRRTGASAAWEDITGASGPDYTTSAINKSHDGYQYRVIVTDVLGNSATSETAILSVNTLPATGDAAQPLAYVFMTVLFAVISLILLKKRRAV